MSRDTVLGFTVPGRHARGRILRLGPTLETILAAHDYPPTLAGLLSEALVLTALVGSTLRPDEGQMTLQAQAKGGPVDLLVCDYKGGELRGYLRIVDPERAALLTRKSLLSDIFGTGYLAITRIRLWRLNAIKASCRWRATRYAMLLNIISPARSKSRR
jgi:molecular chaperone Hsp33